MKTRKKVKERTEKNIIANDNILKSEMKEEIVEGKIIMRVAHKSGRRHETMKKMKKKKI